ncbi:MAG: transcription elongation factor GreAB [Verrucomicrobiota bacterium]
MTFEDKQQITRKIIAALETEAESYRRAARAAQAAATDPDSKAENKYDTRTLEASYLARGVAVRVVETEQALAEWEAMPPRDFSAMLPVGVGALVVLENSQGRTCCCLGPGGGGLSVPHDGMEVLVITPASPLGRQLMKRREGEVFLLATGAARLETVITAVC